MKSDCIWMDGELVSFEDATVHVLNPTMHYGTGVFEGIRCYKTSKGPAVFRLREHLQRLIDSAQIAGILDLSYTIEDLYQAVHRTILANGFDECYIRPLIYMLGPLGLNLDDWKPAVSIAVWYWAPFLGKEAAEAGVRMMVSSFTRHHPNVMMTKAKISGNYVNSTLAKTVAVRAGFDEAVMLDAQGYVAECSGENLFMVRDGVIYTPPRDRVLEGITRDAVITLARDLNIEVVEEQISRDQLYIADEVFVCGTATEVVPAREIDYRNIGNNAEWPVTRAIQKAFFEVVHGEGARSYEWLDYVDETVYAV
ncbi:MAG: branched-chain amino acid transaminase [Anaerolineales bacterium]|nr:branched-chain amino acid transaminase [Anaerolineales bacterium]